MSMVNDSPSWLVVLALLSVTSGACSQSEPRATESDALSMGFTLLECSPVQGVPLYAKLDAPLAEVDYCDAAREALGHATEQHLATQVATHDSIAVITAWSAPHSRSPNTDGPESFVDVTFDLISHSMNLRVILDRPGGLSEITWAPKGLRY